MSQITRCPHCQTSFKVVADQLRLAEGWVRCGQCKQIFDAFECLVDDDAATRPAPPLLSLPPELTRAVEEVLPPDPQEPLAAPEPPPAEPAPIEPDEEDGGPEPEAPTPAWRAHVHDLVGASAAMPVPLFGQAPERPDAPDRREPVLWPVAEEAVPGPVAPESVLEPVMPPASPPQAEPEPEPLPEPALEASREPEPEPESESESESEPESELKPEPESELEPESRLEPEPPPLALQETADMPKAWPAASAWPAAAQDEAADDFDFVRAARRGAFWRRPLVRLCLGLVFLLLAGALGLQVALRERDNLAALYPQARPWLARLCEPLACTLAAPRRIADVVIDASSFVRERSSDPVYVLQLSVKNGAAMGVATPAFELTLMDAREQPVLRRVLTAAELGAPAELDARGSWSGSVRLRVLQGAEQVSGYRLLAFYP